jgi:hypothetical protein
MGVPPLVAPESGKSKKDKDKNLYCAPFINTELITPLSSKNNFTNESNNLYTIYNNELKGINHGNIIYQHLNINNINSINNGFNNNSNQNNNFNNNYNNRNCNFNGNNFNNKNNNNYNSFNNNNFNNNQYQKNQNNNISQNVIMYKQNWMDKIHLYNQLMNQGYSDSNKEQLRNGI